MNDADASFLWQPVALGGRHFEMLNLDHPAIATYALGDIEAGVAVYYDTRWAITEQFCRFLLSEPAWMADQAVLVLGAGVGLETLVIGSLCSRLYINDLAPGALQLCAEQLRRNGMTDFVCIPGRYEDVPLAAVDLLAGCSLVYDRRTAAAMRRLLDRRTPPVLLMNDNLPVFRKLLRETSRKVRPLGAQADYPCLLLT